MAQQFINPFPEFSSDFNGGLDYLINNLPGNPTFVQLNQCLYDYVYPLFNYPGTRLNNLELKSYLPMTLNAYLSSDIKGISIGQIPYIGQLLDGIKNVPPLQIGEFIAEVQDNISQQNLSVNEQNQLFMATAIGLTCFEYWLNIINNGGGWQTYFYHDAPVNIANLPYWVEAAIFAAIYFTNIGNYDTNSDQPPKISGPDYVTVLTASIGLAAGKVIFKWMPNVKSFFTDEDGVAIGGFTKSMQGDNSAMSIGRKNEECHVSNNCNQGNCKWGCGKR